MPNKSAGGALVEFVTFTIRERLSETTNSGRHTPQVETADLERRLRRNLENGDLIDVMALAAMILMRGRLYDES